MTDTCDRIIPEAEREPFEIELAFPVACPDGMVYNLTSGQAAAVREASVRQRMPLPQSVTRPVFWTIRKPRHALVRVTR